MATTVVDFFPFVIHIVLECEKRKCWKKNTEDCQWACGYTAPSAALLIDVFSKNGIHNEATLAEFFTTIEQTEGIKYSIETFIFEINETVGNLLNVAEVYCSGTETKRGIDGILRSEMTNRASGIMKDETLMKVYPIKPGGVNLNDGPNIVSFINRNFCTIDALATGDVLTFHHATLWIDRATNKCVIIDSWAESDDDSEFHCRPLEYRMFELTDVIHGLDIINGEHESEDWQEGVFAAFDHFFRPVLQDKFMKELVDNGGITAFTINPDYIQHVTARVTGILLEKLKHGIPIEDIMEQTELGGSPRKKTRRHRKKTKKLRKRFKKHSKSVRKYIK